MPEWGLTTPTRRSKPYGLPVWWLEPGKVITDPVHGDVFITRLEQALLDTEPMQRLRRVRQLGTTHLVYPGATHTRFTHSLGSLRVVQTLLDVAIGQRNRHHAVDDLFAEWMQRAREEYGTEAKDADADASPTNGHPELVEVDSGDFSESGEAPWREAYRRQLGEVTVLARLGALLHDLGHLPFGHTVEDDLRLLHPHDANESRFKLQWQEVLDQAAARVRVEAQRKGIPDAITEGRIGALDVLRPPDGRIYKDLRWLILSAAKDETGKRADPVKEMSHYRFVADMVGNTICADLLDYLERDHFHTGLPIRLGQRYLQSFYITPKRSGGIYQERMALLIHRDGRERKDVLSEILKHLRYRYELQERVFVHHLKLAADAMVGKMLELWLTGRRDELRELAPDDLEELVREIDEDFSVPPPAPQSSEVDRASDGENPPPIAGGAPESGDGGDNEGSGSRQSGGGSNEEESTDPEEAIERRGRWELEKLLLTHGDDGLVEHFSSLERGIGEARDAAQEIGRAIRDRYTFKHAANAAGAYAAEDLYAEFGSAEKRRELEEEACVHAEIGQPWRVILWIPGPEMRLKLAELLVDHGTGIAKFKDYSRLGSDIYEAHRALWTISVFTHPEISQKQVRAALAKLAQLLGIGWDTHREQLGEDSDVAPLRLAALEVLGAQELEEKRTRLLALPEAQRAARGQEAKTHSALVNKLRDVASGEGLLD